MLFTGDNLDIMNGMNSNMVDLIYTDPPFNSKRTYSAPIGTKAAGSSFKDMWTWDDVDVACLGRLYKDYPHLVNFIYSVGDIHSKAMASYLAFMTQRIIEMHRVLKPSGSMYLHVDPTASHYLKIILDRVFGKNNFRNEIVWHYYNGTSNIRGAYVRKHDILMFYTKDKKQVVFNEDNAREPYAEGSNFVKNPRGYKDKYKPNPLGKRMHDVWRIPTINNMAKERTGYPTQKPLKLLRRIIEASSNQGDIVMDPFCGCATAMVSAQHLHRKWIGIDIELQARDLVIDRLSDAGGLFGDFTHVQKPPKRDDITPIKLGKKGLREQLHKEQKGICNGCMNKYQIKDFDIDHILPRAKGGQDNVENLQLLCGNCNKVKGDRTMDYLNAQIAARMAVIQRVSY